MTGKISDTLWLRFAEDTSMPLYLTAEEQKQLEDIFDLENPKSLWSKAMANVGATLPKNPPPAIKWVNHYPYINWSFLSHAMSGESVTIIKDDNGNQEAETRMNIGIVWKIIKLHWHSSSYLNTVFQNPIPTTDEERLEESLTLGLCILLLQQRLKIQDEKELAAAMKNPEQLPKSQLKLISKISKAQSRRTHLSSTWEILFKEKLSQKYEEGPQYFWNECEDQNTAEENAPPAPQWEGTAVSGNNISARVVVVESLKKIPEISDNDPPPIIIFKQARASTVKLFPKAAGVIFCAGGAVSHACTVAREQNVSCITAVGKDFMTNINQLLTENPDLKLTMNTDSGVISVAS